MASPGLVSRAACSSARASACCRAAERTRTGRTGSRSRVRASIRDLRCRWTLPWMVSAAADGAGRGPASPPGGVIDGPLGQVEVEGPDRGQELAVADPLGVDHGLAAGGGGDGLRLGPHALFPGVGDLGAEVQAVDAGMVGFQVRPEHAQAAGRAAPGWRSPSRAGVPAGSRRAGHGWAGRRAGDGRSFRRACAGPRCAAGAAAPALPGRRSPSRGAAGSRRRRRFWPRRARRPRCPAAQGDPRW